MAEYGTILTSLGERLIAAHLLEETKLELTHLAVGDGGGESYQPHAGMTALRGERWRGRLNAVAVDKDAPNVIVADALVPAEVGGFTIREAGLFDAQGNLIGVMNTPATEKIESTDGVNAEQYIQMVLVVSSTESIELDIDTSLVMASKRDIEAHNLDVTAHPDIRAMLGATGGRSGAVSIYIDAKFGDDNNNGLTETSPVATLEKASEIANNYWIVDIYLSCDIGDDSDEIVYNPTSAFYAQYIYFWPWKNWNNPNAANKIYIGASYHSMWFFNCTVFFNFEADQCWVISNASDSQDHTIRMYNSAFSGNLSFRYAPNQGQAPIIYCEHSGLSISNGVLDCSESIGRYMLAYINGGHFLTDISLINLSENYPNIAVTAEGVRVVIRNGRWEDQNINGGGSIIIRDRQLTIT